MESVKNNRTIALRVVRPAITRIVVDAAAVAARLKRANPHIRACLHLLHLHYYYSLRVYFIFSLSLSLPRIILLLLLLRDQEIVISGAVFIH